jgi:hypothetical protein
MNGISAEIINITEFQYDEAEIPVGGIKLGISSDDKVYYQSLFADSELNNGILTLVNYYGKILVPKYTGINIIGTSKNIDGIIASPTNIESSGNITLNILKNSNLELCLMALGRLLINDRMISAGNDEIYTYGKDFKYFTEKYEPDLHNKKIDNGIYDITVCMYYNLINIHNNGEMINLDYDELIKGDTKEVLLHDKKRTLLRLEREIAHAVSVEDYIKAAHAQKELQSLRDDIKSNIIDKNWNK